MISFWQHLVGGDVHLKIAVEDLSVERLLGRGGGGPAGVEGEVEEEEQV